jgi:hypothetical protein
MERYSIVTYNFGNYELLREPVVVSENCDYICITDRHDLKSDVWKFVHDEEINNSTLTERQRAYKAKNLFLKYVTTDVAIRIDGSIGILDNCDELVEKFRNAGYDAACTTHLYWDNALTEYYVWEMCRGNSPEFTRKYIDYCHSIGFDCTTTGLIETMFVIQKNNEINKKINENVVSTMMEVNNFEDQVEQIWYTLQLLLNYDKIKILFLYHRQPVNSRYFQHYYHNSDIKVIEYYDTSIPSIGSFNNNIVDCNYI